MTKLITAFRNFAKVPKKQSVPSIRWKVCKFEQTFDSLVPSSRLRKH